MICRMVLSVILPAALGLILSGSPSTSAAASFNCTLARSPLEKEICADPPLSRADEAMADAYRAQRAATPVEFQQRLLDSQRSWLAYIGPFCSAPANRHLQCLRKGFEERTEELKRTTRQVGPRTFFQASTYAVRFSPDRPNWAFTHKTELLQIARPQGQEDRLWNKMTADSLRNAAQADEDPDDLDASVRLSGASADLISTRFGTSIYSANMAHPQSYSHAVVWSLRLARPLTLADLFKDVRAGKDRLARQALAHFEGPGPPESVTPAAIRQTLDGEGVWEATPTGLLLAYDPYAFGCYPCTGQALVPWAELAPYLREDIPFNFRDLRD